MGIIGLVGSVLALIGTVAVAWITNKLNGEIVVARGRAEAAEADLAEMKSEVREIRADVTRLSSVLGVAVHYIHQIRSTHPSPEPWPVELYPYV